MKSEAYHVEPGDIASDEVKRITKMGALWALNRCVLLIEKIECSIYDWQPVTLLKLCLILKVACRDSNL